MSTAAIKNPSAGKHAILISPHRRIISELIPLLAQSLPTHSVTELQGYPSRRSLVELKTNSPFQLCFLDVMADRAQAVSCLSEIVSVVPTVQIVVLVSDKEQDSVLQCLRQGAHEFLLHPFTADQLQAVSDRLVRLNPEQHVEQTGKVYCLIPAKGACGASTVACNLAYQWKKNASRRVLLADLDPLTGTISFLLKLKGTYSFFDAIFHSTNLDLDLWKGLVMQCGGVDVLLPPENPVDGIHDITDATPIVDSTRKFYDDVVVDLNGAYGEWSLTAARLADEILLVTTNELPALQAAQRVFSYLESNRIPKSRIRLVINRYNKDIGLNKDMIETALRTEVYHVLPSDYEGVQRALLEGKPVPGSSSFGKSLAALAQKLAGFQDKQKQESTSSSSFFGVFSSLFGKKN